MAVGSANEPWKGIALPRRKFTSAHPSDNQNWSSTDQDGWPEPD